VQYGEFGSTGFPSYPNGYGVTSVQQGCPGDGVAGVLELFVCAQATSARAPGVLVATLHVKTSAADRAATNRRLTGSAQ
jgi:hypothetical protein